MNAVRSTALITLLLTAATAVVTSAAEAKLGRHNFQLPEGFSIRQIAGPPLADRPICADFDEQGRLCVADSSSSIDPMEEQVKNPPHRIVRLEDTDGDEKFAQVPTDRKSNDVSGVTPLRCLAKSVCAQWSTRDCARSPNAAQGWPMKMLMWQRQRDGPVSLAQSLRLTLLDVFDSATVGQARMTVARSPLVRRIKGAELRGNNQCAGSSQCGRVH